MNRSFASILLTSCWCAALASEIPPPRPVDVAALVRQLGSEDFAEREAASRRLATLNVDAPPQELLAALQSPNPEIRNRARRAVKELKTHIVRERERVASARLHREERFARRGQIDLYVASTANTKWSADDDRLWLPAFDLGVRTAEKAELKGDRLPQGPAWVKHFPIYRKSLLQNKLIRTDNVFTLGRKGRYMFVGGVMSAGVDSPKTIKGLIVSRGSVRVHQCLNNSLVLATGDVVVGEGMLKSAVICDGNVHNRGMVGCFIIARGNVTVDGSSKENTVIAGGSVSLKEPYRETPAAKALYDPEDRVQTGVTRPLGYITFFELSTVGVEVNIADKSVKVAAIEKGKPFDHAGVWVGDVITEVNGKKPDSPESLRRLLRDALAVGDAAVKLQRGEKTVTVRVSLPE